VPAEADTLREIRNRQGVGAIRDEGGPELGGAVAVAVGLDHGEDFPARAHHPAHRTDVRGGGIEVDLEGGRPGRARRRHGSHGGSSSGRILGCCDWA